MDNDGVQPPNGESADLKTAKLGARNAIRNLKEELETFGHIPNRDVENPFPQDRIGAGTPKDADPTKVLGEIQQLAHQISSRPEFAVTDPPNLDPHADYFEQAVSHYFDFHWQGVSLEVRVRNDPDRIQQIRDALTAANSPAAHANIENTEVHITVFSPTPGGIDYGLWITEHEPDHPLEYELTVYPLGLEESLKRGWRGLQRQLQQQADEGASLPVRFIKKLGRAIGRRGSPVPEPPLEETAIEFTNEENAFNPDMGINAKELSVLEEGIAVARSFIELFKQGEPSQEPPTLNYR